MFNCNKLKFLLPFLCLILISTYLTGCNIFEKKDSTVLSTPEPISNLPAQTVKPEPTEQPTSDEQAIVNFLVKVAPVTAGELTAKIFYNDGKFAFGDLDHTYPETVAGYYFIVEKKQNDWELIYYGQITSDCRELTNIKLPEELINICNNQVQITDN